MRFTGNRDELGEAIIRVLGDGEAELVAIADEVDAEVGPVFARIRRFVDDGTVRVPEPGVYALTDVEEDAEPGPGEADRG